MSYDRVLPRDLFNEAKLLKCLGQLVLKIHDGQGLGMAFHDDEVGNGFDIVQEQSSGALYCHNLGFSIGNEALCFECAYNSKQPYPLILAQGSWDRRGESIGVFDDDGNFTSEFTKFLKGKS